MKFLIIFFLLFGLAVSNIVPKASTDSTSPQNSNDCGFVHDKDVTTTKHLLGDHICHDLDNQGLVMKYYNTTNDCGCVFYANDKCSAKPAEEVTGWFLGHKTGHFKTDGTTHYKCVVL